MLFDGIAMLAAGEIVNACTGWRMAQRIIGYIEGPRQHIQKDMEETLTFVSLLTYPAKNH